MSRPRSHRYSASTPILLRPSPIHTCFFFTSPATSEIYTLSLHDALPIFVLAVAAGVGGWRLGFVARAFSWHEAQDRKSTRLNSSHGYISYAVFCLKKKKTAGNLIAVSWWTSTQSAT